MLKPKQPPAGIVPPKMTEEDYVNMLAVVNGQASPQQAKSAMEWVMREAARVQDQPFMLGGEDGRRATDFAAGRMYTGHLIRQLIHPDTLKRIKAGASQPK
jgi:hypothetical protein